MMSIVTVDNLFTDSCAQHAPDKSLYTRPDKCTRVLDDFGWMVYNPAVWKMWIVSKIEFGP